VTVYGHPLDGAPFGDGIERPARSTNFLADLCNRPDNLSPCEPVYRWNIVRQSDAVGVPRRG
jgi:hypothetical protein